MSSSASRFYAFDLDVQYFIPITQHYSFVYSGISLLIVNPIFFYMVLCHSASMNNDYKYGILALQVFQVCGDVWMCLGYQLYPLIPLPGFICNGLLCRAGVSGRILLTGMSIVVINIVFVFMLLLFRVHQQMLRGSHSRMRLTENQQHALCIALYVLLFANVVGFYIWGSDISNLQEQLNNIAMSWLKQYPIVQLYGQTGEINEFVNARLWVLAELKLLAVTVAIVFPLVPILSFHLMKQLANEKKHVMSKTQQMVARACIVLLTRFAAAGILFILPLAFLFTGMIGFLDWIPSSAMPYVRAIAVCMFYSHSVPCTIVFLSMNSTYRRVLKKFIYSIFRKDISQVDILDPSLSGGATITAPRREGSSVSHNVRINPIPI